MKIAGIMQTRGYNWRCRAFEHLKQMTDHTIVFDDGSLAPVDLPADVLIRKENKQFKEFWNCTANMTTLYYWARVLECDWIVRMDDDMILGEGLRRREDIEKIIAETDDVDIINVRLLDLWESHDRVRVDGIWCQKQFPLICRNWFYDDNIILPDPNRRLHQVIFPRNKKPRTTRLGNEKTVYHTGCMTRSARERRVLKYSNEDPSGEFQSDYSYMLSEVGIQTAPVPTDDVRYIRTILT